MEAPAKRRKLNADPQALLLEAVRTGNLQMCVQALGEGAFVDEQTLFLASESGHADICGQLLTAPDSCDCYDLLVEASSCGHVRVCELLIPHNDVLIPEDDLKLRMYNDALELAVRNGYADVCRLLVENGADILLMDDMGICILCVAAECGHPHVCAMLIDDYGREVDALDLEMGGGEEASPLMYACSLGHTDVCTVLLDRGARIWFSDGYEQHTPLIVSIIGGHMHIVRLLIERGANVNQGDGSAGPDELGYDLPLNFASKHGHMDICKLLLEHGAYLHRCFYMSPLMSACVHGHVDVAKLLLDRGADMEQRDDQGFTAFEFARRRGHENICNLLRQKYMIRYRCMLLCLHRCMSKWRSAGKVGHTNVPRGVLQLIWAFSLPA